MSRLIRTLAAAFVAAATACTRWTSAPSPQVIPAAVPATQANQVPVGNYIQHVVVIIQENRSFENFFAGWPGADAPTYGWYKPCKTCKRFKVKLHLTSFKGKDLVHSYQGAVVDYDGGKMDGFGLPLLGNREISGYRGYAYVGHRLIQPYRTMASHYVLADHMFPTELGGSFTAHLDLVAGTTNISKTQALVDQPSGGPWGCDAPPGTWTWTVDARRVIRPNGPYPCLAHFRTMADLLNAAGVSWKYYEPPVGGHQGSWSAFDAIRDVREGSGWSTGVLSATPQTNVLTDPANGALPSVAWVTPDFHDSDHLDAQSDTGPSWVAAVVNAVGESKYWSSTAIVLLWDDWGGWYDNVPPPQKNFVGLGIRVPCLIISPYAQAGYVTHTQYEYGSILKFIEEAFNLPSLGQTAYGYTDSRANSIVDAFDFTQLPRAFVPIPAKYPTSYFLNEKPSYKMPDDE
jgi:phospholipase C